jgi:hypothetical protein
MESNSSSSPVPLHIRRVVTGHRADRASEVVTDGPPALCSAYEHIPGMMTRLVWATGAACGIPGQVRDPTDTTLSHVPRPGETRFIVATFPPDSVFASPEFRADLAVAENGRLSPGLADLFEPDGFHRTDSIDYVMVLDGEITLELGDGSKTRLRQHDVVVQNGTRHAWRNESDRPATIAFVLIGTAR